MASLPIHQSIKYRARAIAVRASLLLAGKEEGYTSGKGSAAQDDKLDKV
ncbi:hypothetical protein [Pontibacter mucosus]|nr:hypothetical protein [Pontibacter mucosus]